MKKYFYPILFMGFMLALGLQTASCNKDKKKKVAGNVPVFSLDSFENQLKTSFGPSGAIGWSYAIVKDGLYARGNAYGKARNNADGSRSFTLNRKINIASVSKFLTAVAVMQLLDARGLTPESKINNWLPPSWNKGPGVSEITFGDLLGHTSGLSSYNTQFSKTLGYTGLQLMIDSGKIRSTNYNYLNANFAIFRVLIPSLWKGLDGAPTIGLLDSATTENVYLQYMREKVFEPIGLNNIDCEAEWRSIATLYYATTDLEVGNGSFYGSWSSIAGGGGYYMTTMELAAVLAYFRHSEILLKKEQRQIMEANRYGMDRVDEAREIHGNYYGKNGSISDGAGRGTYEQIVMFPNGIEVVVMFNTQGMVFAGGEQNIRRAIYDAYNKSWK